MKTSVLIDRFMTINIYLIILIIIIIFLYTLV